MGSPGLNPSYGRYVGNNNATPRDFALGFRPKRVVLSSSNGEVRLQERMAKGQKHTAGSDAAMGTEAEFKLTDTGFQVASTDTAVNANAVEYHWEAY